jgi:hypothetical protein
MLLTAGLGVEEVERITTKLRMRFGELSCTGECTCELTRVSSEAMALGVRFWCVLTVLNAHI